MKTLSEIVEEMEDYLESEVEPDLDQIEKWRMAIAAHAKKENNS